MSKHSVVIIEDNAEDVDVISAGLSSEIYSLSVFEDGLVAWAHLEENAKSVDVVILGKTIPNKSGMEIVESMHSHPDLKNTPIIVQTVDERDGKCASAIQRGAHFYLNKPLNPKQVSGAVKASIRMSQVSNSDSKPTSFVEIVKGS